MAVKQILVGKAGSSATPLTLIKGDSNTQIIEMIVERYYGGVDLAGLAWSVTAENANGATDEYRGIEAIANGTNIAVRWKVTGTATAAVGLTKFKLSGYAQDGSDALIWQSGDYFIRVNDTLEHVPGAETQAALTEVQKLIIYVDGELNKVIKAGNDAAEAAKAANKAADRANSVADGKNEGRITALEQFTTKPEEPYAVTGKLVQLDNFEGMPMNAVTRIEPVQAGSGDPYPAGGGKNLAKSIYASGETAVYMNCLYVDADIMPNTTYTISFVANADNANMLLYLNESLASYQDFRITGARQSVTFTTKESMSSKPVAGKGHIMFKNGTALAAPMTFADVQLELGSTATAYAPSSNIRPITGHTGAKLTRSGKNLLPFMTKGNTFEKNGMTGKVTDAGLVVSGMPSRAYADVVSSDLNLPAGTYTVRGGNPSGGLYTQINVTRADGTAFYYNDSTFELYGDEKQVQAFVQCSSTIVTMSNYVVLAQLEAGSTATTFAPYQGETFSASFDQTVYGGTLDWNTGVLTVDRAVYNFTGNEPFSLASGGIPYFSVTKSAGVIASVARFDQTSAENGSCSHYKSVSAWSGNACEYMGVTHSFRFTDTRFAAVDDFKAYLAEQKTAGTPVQVCCKLATPTTIQLTPAQLTALQGMNNIFCDAGETTVSGRKDILWLTSGLIEQIDTLKKAIVSLGGNV